MPEQRHVVVPLNFSDSIPEADVTILQDSLKITCKGQPRIEEVSSYRDLNEPPWVYKTSARYQIIIDVEGPIRLEDLSGKGLMNDE
jgi:hypothetical protein